MNKSDKRGQTPLIAAVVGGNREKIKEILNNLSVNVNEQGDDGKTALHFACILKDEQAVRMLLDHKDIDARQTNCKGSSALHFAASRGSPEICSVLLRVGLDINAQNKEGQTPLYAASNRGHAPLVPFLLQHGAKSSLATECGDTPLHVACRNHDTDVINALMDDDALATGSGNSDGNTALMVFLQELPRHKKEKENFSPRFDEVFRVFSTRRDFDVNQRNNRGQTLLHLAIKFASRDVIEAVLSQRKCDRFARDNDGRTCLHYFCERLYCNSVELPEEVLRRKVSNTRACLSTYFADDFPHKFDFLKFFVSCCNDAHDFAPNASLVSLLRTVARSREVELSGETLAIAVSRCSIEVCKELFIAYEQRGWENVRGRFNMKSFNTCFKQSLFKHSVFVELVCF